MTHELGGGKELFFGYFLVSVPVGGIEVNPFDEFHVVQKRVERHKVGETDLPARLAVACRLEQNQINIAASSGQAWYRLGGEHLPFM